MAVATAEGSYKPLTGPYASTSAELLLSLIPEPSSLSSSNPPGVNITTHLRAVLRAAQADLNEECEKTGKAKLELERADLEFTRLQLEKITLERAVKGLHVADRDLSSDLPQLEDFDTYSAPHDPYHKQAIKKARYEFELQEIRRREEEYASLQAKLEGLRKDSSLLRKKAILADSSLIDVQQAMIRAKEALSDIGLPSQVPVTVEEDVDMDSAPEDGVLDDQATSP